MFLMQNVIFSEEETTFRVTFGFGLRKEEEKKKEEICNPGSPDLGRCFGKWIDAGVEEN